MTRRLRHWSVVLLPALAGCATHADLVVQDRQLRGLVQENRRQLEQVQREVERLRGDPDLLDKVRRFRENREARQANQPTLV